MKRTVTVLQDDIDNGRPELSEECAVACAVKRELADLVGENKVVVTRLFAFAVNADNQVEHSWRLPPEAGAFIYGFDRGCPVSPFTFEVEVPQ